MALYQEPDGTWTGSLGSDIIDTIKEAIVWAEEVGPLVLYCSGIEIRIDTLTDTGLAYEGYVKASRGTKIGPFHRRSTKPLDEDPFLDALEI